VLSKRPAIEQLVLLDDEVANKIIISRYEGPVDAVEWGYLEEYYSGLFADFITERIEGLVDPTPVDRNRERFHQFRSDLVALNRKLPAQRFSRADVVSGPAETVLLKHLRERGFDPNLDTLVEKGLVEKDKKDRRTNIYTVTRRGQREIDARREWEQEYLAETDAE